MALLIEDEADRMAATKNTKEVVKPSMKGKPQEINYLIDKKRGNRKLGSFFFLEGTQNKSKSAVITS